MSRNEQYPSTYEGLVQLVERLRGPDGCPWDREQTHQSLVPLFLEECYELVEAIEQGDNRKLAEELGDVLFHLALQVQLGRESGSLTQEQVLQALVEKLVRRHPHVFGDVQVADSGEVKANWAAIKRMEKPDAEPSLLEGVPGNMPALSQAQQIQERAGRAEFDWSDLRGVLNKVVEEVEELAEAKSDADRERELGDILFSVVNVARWMGVDAEGALRRTNFRFRQRFAAMENLCRERGLDFSEASADEKEALWQEAKALEG